MHNYEKLITKKKIEYIPKKKKKKKTKTRADQYQITYFAYTKSLSINIYTCASKIL